MRLAIFGLLGLSVSIGTTACSSPVESPTPNGSVAIISSQHPGARSWKARTKPPSTYQLFYKFVGTSNQAVHPHNELFVGPTGGLYGVTTLVQGSSCGGCAGIFKINQSASKQDLYHFGFVGGYTIYSYGVVRDSSGALYGTTLTGGSGSCAGGHGCGTVYKLTASSASGSWLLTILYSFGGGTDGISPAGTPLLISNTLYGVTEGGGGGSGSGGPGTIYKVNTDGSGYAVLHSFSGGVNSSPKGPLVGDASGVLYGTTFSGSGNSCNCGAVFSIRTDGSHFSILHKFTGGSSDGANPFSGVILVNGNIYGTTPNGGPGCGGQGCGVLYKIASSGSGYTESVVYDFQPTPIGYGPGPLRPASDLSGNIFGTTEFGGYCSYNSSGCGTVYEISSSGTYTDIHDFQGPPHDGYNPLGGVAFDAGNGRLYGTTAGGGNNVGPSGCASGCGTVYYVTP